MYTYNSSYIPSKPIKQLPHVPDTFAQSNRFKFKQIGALEQLTEFKVSATYETIKINVKVLKELFRRNRI
jgi:hypothetical protein